MNLNYPKPTESIEDAKTDLKNGVIVYLKTLFHQI